MTGIESFTETQTDNTENNEDQTTTIEEIIDLDDSDSSDIEVIQVTSNLAFRKRQMKLKRLMRHRQRTKVRMKSVNCAAKDQDSYIKEEIIISDASDSSDENFSNTLISHARFKNISRKQNRNRDDSLTSITLNCPKCNKTETVFCTTITSICKECKVNMDYVCNKCNLRYNSMPALFRHKKLQCQFVLTNKKPLNPVNLFVQKCSKCGLVEKAFRMKKDVKCKTCQLNMIYECRVCSKGYTSYSCLYSHANSRCQNTTKTYYCNDCNYSCTKQEVLLRHLNQNHAFANHNFLCTKCGTIFHNGYQLKAHEIMCGVPNYQCKFCPYKPKFQENLKRHLLTQHRDCIQSEDIHDLIVEMANEKRKSIDKIKSSLHTKVDRVNLRKMKRIYCSQCDKWIPYYTGCSKCEVCGTAYNYGCSNCNGVFRNAPALYRHIRRKHGKIMDCCENCGRSFTFFGDANAHRKICGKEPSYECEICNFRTRYKYNLRNHMGRLHNENRRSFVCTDCGVVYKTEKSMKRHYKLGCEISMMRSRSG